MLALIRAFQEIAFFRSGPQSLPDSQPLLVVSLCAYLLSGFPVVVETPLALFVEFGLLIFWCGGLLLLYNKLHRVRQTLSALCGTGVLFNIATIAVLALIDLGVPAALWSTLLIIVLLWAVAVHGYILGEALSKSFGFGVALAVVYFVLSGVAAQLTSVPDEPPPIETIGPTG